MRPTFKSQLQSGLCTCDEVFLVAANTTTISNVRMIVKVATSYQPEKLVNLVRIRINMPRTLGFQTYSTFKYVTSNALHARYCCSRLANANASFIS